MATNVYLSSRPSTYESIIKLDLLFKLSKLNSNFTLTMGYINLDLNNLALRFITGLLQEKDHTPWVSVLDLVPM